MFRKHPFHQHLFSSRSVHKHLFRNPSVKHTFPGQPSGRHLFPSSLSKHPLLTFTSLFALALMVLFGTTQAAAKDFIPAGTILHCTMDETNFSPKTAMVGDPVLCHLGPLGSFGHSIFPRGAQLGGHLQDYKAPGHFWGKGWMAIEFDRLILPNAEVLPLSAKITSAPHLKTDPKGDIRGGGHPKRDAVLWLIPPLWPVKILTLPARGPYPALKGESRLSLRLMEDVEVPFPTANGVPSPRYRPSNYDQNASADYENAAQQSATPVPSQPVMQQAVQTQPEPAQVQTPAPQLQQVDYNPAATSAPRPQLTIVALRGGAALLAKDYWVEGTKLRTISAEGVERVLPLSMIDLTQTVKLNGERNVEFTLRSRNTIEQ